MSRRKLGDGEKGVALTFGDDGSVSFVYEDAARVLEMDVRKLLEMGVLKTERVSHVEPMSVDGVQGGWLADMGPVNGPRLGPFNLRSEALAAEREWLRANKGV